MSNWKLGDRVKISHRLNKQTWDPETYEKFAIHPYPHDQRIIRQEKRWVPVPAQHEGVIVGHRTIQNNWVDWIGDDEGNYAVPTKYISAYLVAYDLRKNPVYVLPEHMERTP